MDREKALKQIFQVHNNQRIKAAIYLAENSVADDALVLIDALDGEPVPEIQHYIRQAILRAIGGERVKELVVTEELKELLDPSVDKVIENVTHAILHEISPLIGRLRVVASQEVTDFKESRTNNVIQRINSELKAIRILYTAVQPAVFTEFDLAELIQNIVSSLECPSGLEILPAGQSPLVISSDSSLVEVVISNGVRNAIDATDVSLDDKQIVLNWGDTDIDYWVVILDSGNGTLSNILPKLNRKTASRHRGHGLKLASKAATSLSGSITLVERTGSGIKFEFRWPKPGGN